VWLRCGVCGNNRLSPDDYFTTILRPRADSTEVDCNQYATVTASDYSSSAKSSMPIRFLRLDIFQRHLCYLYFCYSHVLTVNKYGHELNNPAQKIPWYYRGIPQYSVVYHSSTTVYYDVPWYYCALLWYF